MGSREMKSAPSSIKFLFPPQAVLGDLEMVALRRSETLSRKTAP
jgi:hypothetical protein